MTININSRECRESRCSICDEYIGAGFDHSECSKIKQEVHAKENETKYPRKKLSKKQTASLGRYLSDVDH